MPAKSEAQRRLLNARFGHAWVKEHGFDNKGKLPEHVAKKGKAVKHPGFKAVQGKIEKEGYSKKSAGAILANASRKASSKAKKKNPRLKRVKGGGMHGRGRGHH